MLRGLEENLLPFIKRVMLEDGSQHMPNNFSQYNEYYNAERNDSDYSLSITIDFCIKKFFGLNEFNEITSFLNSLTLQTVFIDKKEELVRFISLPNDKKINHLNKLNEKHHWRKNGRKIPFSKESIANYISIVKDDDGMMMQEMSLPIEVSKQYSKGLSKSNKNPDFLACIYFFTNGQKSILASSIRSEVMFLDGSAAKKTGYFVISDKFRYKNEIQTLTRADILSNSPLINPITGESLNPNVETNRNDQVNYLFGAPGDVWVGPIHTRIITNKGDINFGKARVMAGASHDDNIPHPFLNYVVKEDKKVIDLRSTMTFEDSFSYKSNINSSLSRMKTPVYTQQKFLSDKIDNFIKNKSIFSNCKFSIRPISRQKGLNEVKTKDNVVLFFGLDKNELLRETTKMPDLLDSLTMSDASITSKLVSSVNISYFEIIRINEREGYSKTLIIGDNDRGFNDHRTINQLNKNISKGFSLKNKTNQIYLESGNGTGNINLYEFTDGELDAFKNDEKYHYKVKLKFKDPMKAYISGKLVEINRIINNLDELLQKVSMNMIDAETGRQVKVFDKYQKQLNPTFVYQSLNPSGKNSLPLGFAFNKQSELPNSVDQAFRLDNDMSSFLSAISSMLNNDPIPGDTGSFKKLDSSKFIMFVRRSLMLSNTTPTLIEKNRSLIALLRDRVEKILGIYSAEETTKKSSGFTSRDYLKSTRSAAAIEDGMILEYEHTFKQSIDLSKTKDHFNWIEEVGSEQSDGLKIISNDSYRLLVENQNITDYITPEGNTSLESTNLFDYSFLPYTSPAILDFQKTDKVNLHINHLQTLRKKLTHDTANYSESVLIPELLATFGIRFLGSKTNLESYLTDQKNYNETEIPVNNGFEDNFGSEFSSLMRKPETSTLSFGSVQESGTSWAGGNYKNYPSNTASSILNLITTKAFERRNIDFLFNERKNMPEGIRVPYATNLFSSEVMSSRETADAIITDVLDNLFDSNGVMKFEQYSYYSYLLNIFARVYYLKGFSRKLPTAFGNESNRFTASSRNNLSFVKDMNWEPLTLSILNAVPRGQTLACKVMLHQDDHLSNLIDTDVINMYKNYFNYNKIFLVKRTGDLITRQEAAQQPQETNTSQPPTIISTTSYGAETRQLLNKEIKMLSGIMSEEDKSEMLRDPKEDIAIKKLLSPMNIENTTYKKPIRS